MKKISCRKHEFKIEQVIKRNGSTYVILLNCELCNNPKKAFWKMGDITAHGQISKEAKELITKTIREMKK